jgi:glyoxylase-like metal-dependent hydrolase (beta-lactamase superfamily II)
MSNDNFPLLSEEGWPRHKSKCSEATSDGAAGVLIKFRRNFVVADHHPVCAAKDAAQLFVDRAATPPRRGGESSLLHRSALIIAAIGLLLSLASLAQAQAPNLNNVEVHILPVQGNVYMLVGAGGNITVQVGSDGVLVVDTQYAPLSSKILEAIRTLSKGPIRYIVNTTYDADHTGGNEPIRRAGSTIAGGNVAGDIQDAAEGAQIIAHDNVIQRMSKAPSFGQPTSTFVGDQKKLFFNGEGIEIIHQPSAHTDGDSMVFFRRSDVITTGDIFTTSSYPVIDLAAGGSIQGVIDGLNRLVDMIIPVYGQEGGTLVIPGHGRLSDMGDVINCREMTIIIRDRVQDMIKKGMTLEQVKAARPTRDYDPLYGSVPGWTTDMFVEAVYKSLKK